MDTDKRHAPSDKHNGAEITSAVAFDTAMRQDGQTLRSIAQRICGILDALEAIHRSGRLHLALRPENILILPCGKNERVILSGAAQPGQQPRPGDKPSGSLSMTPDFAAPEVCNGIQEKTGVPSDLYAVAAMFYASLMGRPLSLEETLRASPPDGADSAHLAAAPYSVKQLVRRILRGGLHTLPSRRYAAASAMRSDLTSLIDLLDALETVRAAHDSIRSLSFRSDHEQER